LNAMKRQGFCHFLYRAMRKYGAENFFVQTLTLANSPGELNALERFFIAKFRSFDSEIGYNLTMGGEGVVPNEATRRKLSELRKQRPSPMRGRHHSVETRRLMSSQRMGNQSASIPSTFTQTDLIGCIRAGLQVHEIADKLSVSWGSLQYRAKSLLGMSISDFKKTDSRCLCEAS